MASGGRLIVASHRGPGGGGGVVPALDAVLAARGGVWVATDGRQRSYPVVRVELTAAENAGYYAGYANSGLWPLCHALVERARFRHREWERYHAVNRRFAEIIAELAGPDDLVWVHDYQLALVPGLLRARRPELGVVVFWHIPWPRRPVWDLCPQAGEIVASLRAARFVGFHTAGYAGAYRDAAGEDAPVRVVPLGIDFASLDRVARGRPVARRAARLGRVLGIREQRVGVGVDRFDYTKGLPHRIEALELLFERHPEHRGAVTFIQVASPTRTDIPEYGRLAADVRAAAARLNERFADGRWRPVRLLARRVAFGSILALYHMADFALVTPLCDGMNLVAKEFVAASGKPGAALVLSRLAGAADELTDAFQVNPLDLDGVAAAVHTALTLPEAQRAARMDALRRQVSEHDVGRWVRANLDGLMEVP